MIYLILKDIYKIYNVGGEEVRALDGVDLKINNNRDITTSETERILNLL